MESTSYGNLDDLLERGLSSAFRRVPAHASRFGPDDFLEPPEDEPEETPEQLDRYPVSGLLGRGGIGLIYRVSDPTLGRDLAIKVLRPSCAQNAEMVERFQEEARVCSRLQHPGVVPIHELGTLADGRPYFTMKIVDGQTLAHLLNERAHPGEDEPRFLEIFEKVCQTIAFSHNRGVVHGDIKPQNIMVGAFGEVQVMDWGFACSLGSRAAPGNVGATGSTSDSGSSSLRIAGTPAYMSPEQAAGEQGTIGSRTDVFGLGAVLCEIITGAPPYLGESKSEVFRRARRGDLADALFRLEACAADRTLVELAAKCLAKGAPDRPADASSVAREIGDYLESLTERARRLEVEAAEARARAQEERRTKRVSVALAATILLAVVLGGGAYFLREMDRHARAARIEQAVALAMERARQHREHAAASDLHDLAAWNSAVAAAREAEALATTREADPELVDRTRELLARLEVEHDQAARNLRASETLEDVRPHMGDDRSAAEQDADYRSTFLDYGIDVEHDDIAAAARTIGGSSIQRSLVGALDDWAFLRKRHRLPEQDGWRRMVKMAKLADPDPWRNALRDAFLAGQLDLLQSLAERAEQEPVSAESMDLLARNLIDRGDRETAIHLYRVAHRRQPENFWINHNLACQLRFLEPAPNDEVARLLAMALAVRPLGVHIMADLAQALLILRDTDNAVPLLERALELDPGYGRARFFLASALHGLGRMDGAEREAREAIRLGEARAWGVLAGVLLDRGFLDEAIDAYRRAVEAFPAEAWARANLGALLYRRGRLDEATVELEEAVACDPTLGVARFNLGLVYRDTGRFEEALDEMRRAEELGGGAEEDWTGRIADETHRTRVMLQLEETLDDVLAGEEPPEAARDKVSLALLALNKREHLAAARLFEAGLDAAGDENPLLAPAFQYDAARAAAHVGLDATAGLSDAGRSHWRERALSWCEAELLTVHEALETGTLERNEIHDYLLRWRDDPGLTRYRESPVLDGLPAAEHDRWTALWADLDGLVRELEAKR